MGMPLNEFSSVPVPSDFLAPDNVLRSSLLVDHELGGIAINDPTEGLQVQEWEARYSGGEIQVRPVDGSTWSTVLAVAGVTELAFTFDQNMRPATAFVAAGVAYYYWFDTVLAAYTTTELTDATSPVITLDDKRPAQFSLNDMLLFYLRAGRVLYRMQRERFGVERDLGAVPSGTTRITRWGMTTGNRVQLEFGVDPIVDEGPGPTGPAYGTAYTDLLTDTMYFESGGDVIPFFQVGRLAGIWRSPMFVLSGHPSFTWARVNGPMTASVVVRLYHDGTLIYTTPAISAATPFRLPPGRPLHLEIEVESQSRVTSVRLASAIEELAD